MKFPCAVLLALGLPCAALAMTTVDGPVNAGVWHYFSQSFYHMSVLPLLALTLILAWTARPSTSETITKQFSDFRTRYLLVWGICVAADWLQGPYVYALYSAYGFSGHEIAQLFVAGFGSSMVFGCFVGSFADKWGRKNCCIAYCVLYIVSCITKHWQQYSVLMLGRVTGGIATSILFSAFECWMVSEACQRHKFSGGLLDYLFGLMFTTMYAAAIFAGFAAQGVADAFAMRPISEGSLIHVGGYCGPFDLSIICLSIGAVLISYMWEENYGGEQNGGEATSMVENVKVALRMFATDRRMILLCIIVSTFEGAMFAFVFNWTPALDSKTVPPPHGLIFALFMMACMCGASISTLASSYTKPTQRMTVLLLTSVVGFGVAASFANQGEYLMTCFSAFCVFECCVGVYFPTIGILKSSIVPEHVRGTMYNLYRVPLNAVVVALLLSNISMVVCFKLCASLLSVAFIANICISYSGDSTKSMIGSPMAPNTEPLNKQV